MFALGLAVSYLMLKPAFARLPFGHWSRVLTGQINRGHYLFVIDAKSVVGFAGWALASTEHAEAWLAGRSNALSEDGRVGECLILNVWDASTAAAHRFLRDQMRAVAKDKRAVYAVREYGSGRRRRVKLRVTEFVESHGEAAAAAETETGSIIRAP